MNGFWCILFILFQISFGDLSPFDNNILQIYQNISKSGQFDDECSASLLLLVNNIANLQLDDPWAFQMLDATSKLPVGFFSLNFGEMGDYTGCLRIESKDTLIKGKYCLGSLSSAGLSQSLQKQIRSKNISAQITNGNNRGGGGALFGSGLSWALCLPHTCSTQAAEAVVNNIFRTIGLGLSSVKCQTKESLNPPLTNGAIVTICFLTIIAAIMIVSTAYDLYTMSDTAPKFRILTAFSVYTNAKNLLKTSKNSSELSSIHGIRFLSMLWVIIGHTFQMTGSASPVSNFIDVIKWADSLESMLIVSGTLSVDTFLLLGGTLMTYLFIKSMKKGISFNIFQYYLHRYIRLTPPLAVAVLVNATLLNYMGSGPRWSALNSLQESCQQYWWSTLLYVQTYVNSGSMCLGQTWYLSVDMQLYILSPFFLIPLWKYPKIGVTIVVSAIVIQIIVPFYIAYEEQLSGLLTNFYPKTASDVYMRDYYIKTHTRAAPWLMGIILGYILSNTSSKITRFPKPTEMGIVALIWTISFAVILTCIYGGHSTLRSEEFDRVGNTFYIAFVRPAWSLCVAWTIFACTTGYSGPINMILSFPFYQVLNRFTYSIYLVHYSIMGILAYSLKYSVYFDPWNEALSFWGIFALSFGVSIFWVLAFESPVMVLEKYLFKTRPVK